MRALCVVPARGGSKGIPGKNLRTVAGIPLVAHAVLTGRTFASAVTGSHVDVVVDTDDPAIASEGRRWGARVPFLRDAMLATDDAATVDCVIALLARMEAQGEAFDVVVLLQPTSPLRSPSDILACWEPVACGEALSSVAVVRDEHGGATDMLVDAGGRFQWASGTAPSRRQDAAEARAIVRPSGSVYISRVDRLLAMRALMVPGETLVVEC